jgi:hypothetical protein
MALTDEQRDQKITDLKGKVDKIYVALLGSELSKDGGLIQRVVDAEAEILVLRRDLEEQKDKESKTALYIKIIWGMAGVIGAGAIEYLISHLGK